MDPLDRAARLVRAGGVIAYPTDTVWGLGGDARRPDVIARVRALKGRDRRPMLILVSDLAQIADWTDPIPEPLRCVVESGLPITGLLPAADAAPSALVGEEGFVGVRIATGWVGELVAHIGAPLLSTSVNRSGAAPPASSADLDVRILRGVDLVADGPEPPGGTPSTLVRASGDVLVVVRSGAVGLEVLSRVAGCEIVGDA